MKVSNLFKKSAKKGGMNSFQKMEEKQLNKVLGGAAASAPPATVAPANKSAMDSWDGK